MSEHEAQNDPLQVSVAYVEGSEHFWRCLQVPAGTTAAQAVAQSGLQQRFPHLELSALKLGVFAKPVKADRVLENGDRVEVYRPITADPEALAGEEADS